MRSLGMKLLTFAVVAITAAPVFAQSDTRAAKADVVIELRPSKIVKSPLGTKMHFAEQLAAISQAPGAPGFSDLERVFAGLVAPATSENLGAIQTGEKNDLQFFARLEFGSAESASKMLEQMKLGSEDKVEKNGKTYHSAPKGTNMPAGTVMFLVNDKVVELASEGFAYRTNEMPFTDALATAWKAMPDSALKVSADGVNARGLLESLAKEGKKNAGGNPIAGALIDLLPTMDNINFSLDLASANLLTLNMVGSDEDKATDINDGFQTLLTIAKPGAKQGLAMIEGQAPEPAAVFGKLVDGMAVKREGKSVTLNIPRPEGFEGAVAEALPIIQGFVLRMMLESGGLGGPGVPGGPGQPNGNVMPSGDF